MKIRIHGDNIVECERTLNLLCKAFNAQKFILSSSIYAPKYNIQKKEKELFSVELLSGHNRWSSELTKVLYEYGAPVRENTDAYITIIENNQERILLALEYCSALPAGNNAWQRNGRALTCAALGIPYFYFAEIGGVELDKNRNVKAPRFPNPIVPFSYLTTSENYQTICLPIYEAHPAISEALRNHFQPSFGMKEGLVLIKAIIEENIAEVSTNPLIQKGLLLVNLLANSRRSVDTFRHEEWQSFLEKKGSKKKSDWIVKNQNSLIWTKKSANKLKTTPTFDEFFHKVKALNCLSIGAKNIPICLIPKKQLKAFYKIVKSIYGKNIERKLKKVVQQNDSHLLVVWITGFKPRGDDSRPDRGLTPLARMLFGNDITLLSIVFGPAISSTWEIFKDNPAVLVEKNGLWEAIINLSDIVLADSATSNTGTLLHISENQPSTNDLPIKTAKGKSIPNQFSEHDVDTAIHVLFSNQIALNVFEGMCNPPGGDWSGISIFDFDKKVETRWTSLPRVSHSNGKRPDHVIQFFNKIDDFHLVIESKTKGRTLANNIGIRLIQYLKDLYQKPPIAIKKPDADWTLFQDDYQESPKQFLSAAAFCFTTIEEMQREMKRGQLDIILAFEFKIFPSCSILHLKFSKQGRALKPYFLTITKQFRDRLIVQIY